MNLTIVLISNKTFEFENVPNSCIIGRSTKCDVVIPDDGVSRQHCKIELIDGDVFVTDLASTNGVYIGGERIPPETQTLYFTSLQLSFGSVQNVLMTLDHHTYSTKKITTKDTPPPLKSTNETLTKTKAIPQQTKKQDTQKKQNTSKVKSKNNFKSIFIIAIVLSLLAGAYFYISKDNQKQPEVENISESLDIN